MKNSAPLRPWQSGILNKNPILIKNASKYQFREMPLRVDKLTGQVARCQLVRDDKNICNEVIKGVGIFKGLTNLN